MNISIISVFPDLYRPFLNTSLIKRAQEKNVVTFDLADFFSFVAPKERIDAPTFGHGAGMLIKPEVVAKAIESKEAVHGKAYKIFFSPHGKKLDQSLLRTIASQLADQKHLMLVAARYEGMDARVEQEYADQVISIGDYVLMGGDLPAMVFLEGLLRHMPGVVGKQESVESDSFSGPLVDHPEYTEPVVWHDKEVPEVVRSGNHAAIAAWRADQALERTVIGHYDWFRAQQISVVLKKQALEKIPNHYVALMHNDVITGDGDRVGTTSVTSLDMHDIARSAKTYGIKHYYLVTQLLDQQKIVRKLLDFWQTGTGVTYNPSRHVAVKQVECMASFNEVLADIEKKEGKKPLVIATSARWKDKSDQKITYHDQAKVWAHKRPVLLIFGTGQGLSQEFLDRCDYLLVPVEGMTEYNHLSVRSAVAIILDRWLGLNIKK
jgi:tRNA (guanine37-N1)-methyltransferase